MAEQDSYDLVVIGGGINGAGIAADAAGRGLSVLLVEADDLASATSSASSKLIHGGLRYLEHYEFRLVREALGERERLLAKAPHLIWPLRFVLPHVAGMRPDIALRAGLFLYDHLAPRRQLGASSALHLNADPAGRALKREYSRGYSYYDCWVDDARLVVANVLAAEAKGAHVLTRTPVIRLTAATPDTWAVELGPKDIPRTVRARAVVNAAGPWVSHVAGLALGGRRADVPKLRLIKGSHIVVPRLTATPDAYIFQNDDGRVVFALPFERDFTLIGTTDVAFTGDPRQVSVSAQEEAYLLAVAARFFVSPPGAADIVWKYAGVRPLEDDGAASASAISRDYHIALETDAGPPVVHVIGGKVTTYRRLAETVLETLQRFFPGATGPWTEREPLPGGEVGPGGFDAWFADFARGHPGFDRQYLLRLARRYGTRTQSLLEGARTIADLGADCGAGLSLREVEFLRSTEWARTADDILWRRTKTGLHVPAQQLRAVNERLTAALLGA